MSGFDDFYKYPDLYMMQKQRVASFEHWPFDNKNACNVSKMAEAGFYWSGNQKEVDTATCFVCQKTLDGWEASDDPWKEHTKHAPQCLFVKYGRAENFLTLEEFLRIFTMVMKNRMKKDLVNIKKNLQIDAQKSMSSFTVNKI